MRSICECAIAGEDEGQSAENSEELDVSNTGFGNAADRSGRWEGNVGAVD